MDSTALFPAPYSTGTCSADTRRDPSAGCRHHTATGLNGHQLRAMLPLQKTTPDPCWLGIRFPHLALDLFTRGQARNGSPIAVSESIKRRELIIDCNPAALAGGLVLPVQQPGKHPG